MDLYIGDVVAIGPLKVRGRVIGIRFRPGGRAAHRYAVEWACHERLMDGWFERSQLTLLEKMS